MKNDRANRVGDELRKIISGIIREDLNDPRIPVMTSVVEVKMSQDLSVAKVYLSVMGTEEEKKACQEAITSASGYIRKVASQKIQLRVAPEFRFILDDSIEKGMNLMNLIDETLKKNKKEE